jgi:hypothetical protein
MKDERATLMNRIAPLRFTSTSYVFIYVYAPPIREIFFIAQVIVSSHLSKNAMIHVWVWFRIVQQHASMFVRAFSSSRDRRWSYELAWWKTPRLSWMHVYRRCVYDVTVIWRGALHILSVEVEVKMSIVAQLIIHTNMTRMKTSCSLISDDK